MDSNIYRKLLTTLKPLKYPGDMAIFDSMISQGKSLNTIHSDPIITHVIKALYNPNSNQINIVFEIHKIWLSNPATGIDIKDNIFNGYEVYEDGTWKKL